MIARMLDDEEIQRKEADAGVGKQLEGLILELTDTLEAHGRCTRT